MNSSSHCSTENPMVFWFGVVGGKLLLQFWAHLWMHACDFVRHTAYPGKWNDPNALLPFHGTGVVVRFARPAPDLRCVQHVPSPLPGRAVRLRIRRWAARAQPRWVIRALSKPSCGGSRASWLLGGLASLPAWASASLSKYLSVHRSSRARTRSTCPQLRVAAAAAPLLIDALLVVAPSSGLSVRSEPIAHRVHGAGRAGHCGLRSAVCATGWDCGDCGLRTNNWIWKLECRETADPEPDRVARGADSARILMLRIRDPNALNPGVNMYTTYQHGVQHTRCYGI